MAAANRLTLIVFPANRCGKTLFQKAQKNKCNTLTETAVVATLCPAPTKKKVSGSIIQVGIGKDDQMEPNTCPETEPYLKRCDSGVTSMETKRELEEPAAPPVAKRVKALPADDDEDEESSSDESWEPSDDEEEEEEENEGEQVDQQVSTRVIKTRSKGPASPPTVADINQVMDGVDEEIDNESDFSSTTEEDEEEDEEDEDDGEEEEEEEEEDDDEYSDDDSFVTSDEEEPCHCCNGPASPKEEVDDGAA